jgi:hypothetical protein
MLVKDLMALLEKEDPNMVVVMDRYSEFYTPKTVERIVVAPRDGEWFSRPYTPPDHARSHGAVYID